MNGRSSGPLSPATSAGEGLRAMVLPAGGILALLLLLAFGRPPSDSLFWRTVYDLGHVPLFGLIALLMLRIIRRGLAPEAGLWTQLVLALLATAVLSLVTELAQIGQAGRDASVGDAVNNLTGAVCFLAIAAALNPAAWETAEEAGPLASRLVFLGAVLALAIAFAPLASVAWSYGMRSARLPVIAELGSSWQAPLTAAGSVLVQRVPAPPGWTGMQGEEVARVRFLDTPWPGVTVREPWPDWTGYSQFRFRVWSDLENPVQLNLRVDDGTRTRAWRDRYDGSVIVMPGANEFTIPLDTIRSGPRNRQMDMSRISQFFLFTSRPEHPFELYFSDVWLDSPWEGITE
ncbi:MAG: hypothetical protein P8080_02455 [Gammaproteobacteria bacterium]